MLVSDITSPSISGHHRISLNEGNILLEPPLLGLLLLLFVLLLLLLLLLLLFNAAKDEEVAEAITASVAAAMSLEKKRNILPSIPTKNFSNHDLVLTQLVRQSVTLLSMHCGLKLEKLCNKICFY